MKKIAKTLWELFIVMALLWIVCFMWNKFSEEHDTTSSRDANAMVRYIEDKKGIDNVRPPWAHHPFSFCSRCGCSWDYVDMHETDYESGYGCFTLCQKCWVQLTPEERLPYYMTLAKVWRASGMRDEDLKRKMPLITAAVLEGK